MSEEIKKSIYLTFSAIIDQLAVQRFFACIAGATQEGYTDIHILMQTMGGNIGDGVCLYNYFQSLYLTTLTIYNCGNVCSAGVIAYLGGDKRIVSETGAFMIHRAHATFQGANSDHVQSRIASLVLDDQRNEAIFKHNIELTAEQSKTHESFDLWLDADQAIAAKIANEKGDFWVPQDGRLINVFQ